MATDNLTVAIVGAGLAGCALGLGLRQIGANVVMLERRAPFKLTDGAGLLLAGNATLALEALGCSDELGAFARPVTSISFTDESEDSLFTIECRRDRWPPFYAVRHAQLRSMLLREAAIKPMFNTSIHSVENGARPILRLSDGSQITCDLVVGADGVHSTIRQQIFQAPAPTSVDGYRGFRFITKCPPSLQQPRYFIGNGATLLLYPLMNGELYCGAGPISPSRFPAATTPREALRSIFYDFQGIALEVLAGLDDATDYIPTSYWHIEQDPWIQEHCALIGDAAHASAPTLAQGAAMAFEDASVMTQCLSNNRGITEALLQYQVRRQARVATIQRASLERMDANRQVSPREQHLRQIAARKLGGHSLERIWGRLIDEAP